MTTNIDPTDERTEAIRRLVDEVQAAQMDVEPFLDRHTPEAVIVNLRGRRVLGRDDLERAMQDALATPLAHIVTTATVHDVRFVRPDVAIVSCTKHVHDDRDPSGAETDRGSLTYVVVDDGDAWRIALAQTTPVAG